MKIVFMGTPEFSVMPLEAINKHHDVKLVVTQEDRKKGRGKKLLPPEVKISAENLGLKVYQPEDINSEEAIEVLRSVEADVFVVVAYGQILRKEILEMPKYGCINIHASLLPRFRGAAPINRAIIDGDIETGISIMKMNKGLDTGDVALSESMSIENLNSEELSAELSKLGSKLILKFLLDLENGNINYTPQDESISTYAEKITKETANIDFNTMNTFQIERLVRGMVDRGGAFTTYKGERLKIFKVEKAENVYGKIAGELLDDLKVKTIDGVIRITELQMPNKKRMDSKSFMLGNSLEKGIVLGG
ncbi:Methionyl-tRNA formyltransferase [Peptoniphilus indolicus]|uniref:Methionyl-tRNA formyltransferase n=2 Tax=Peptoniphilus indolicus TaxID=33030 RepID=G4D494_9FIRM|nr:methionyl-tRNA formyltransferase [Peptoniphilus indolicus ATCC 29427]SUB75911.1 Methionyl-tRNA formyltransferase [Peptoniphilus indolicus]